jgi:hypothetical protein
MSAERESTKGLKGTNSCREAADHALLDRILAPVDTSYMQTRLKRSIRKPRPAFALISASFVSSIVAITA